eukprot:CAMPEP_0179349900 /NCGR_PEP_ID=MMETSP0797-20121207/74478_1 /TAXON_ID=47934 /ORGANISM="Dinophysis acuminata, Strain DAEP01" /LENGTH=1078 /DNA_ID=CAMNT_0021064795 /DNA_START=84 /DNA_END=3320 /DNA_ORIENTATION=+
MSTTNVSRDAFDAFHSGDNAKCGQLLEHISSSKGAYDVKVAHNTLVNDYYKSGCNDPQVLLTQLTQAHDRARERDKKDKGRRKRDEDDEDAYREDEDLSVLRYNQALLCLQLRQHAQATLILEELFENIEPIDDYLAIKICFLLLELCLLQREPEQAITVLAYLEKPNAFLTVLRSERPAAKGVESRACEEGGDADDAKEKTRGGDADDAGDDSAGDASSEALGNSEPRAVGSGRSAGPASAEPAARQGEASEGPLPSLTLGAFLPRHGRAPDTISRAEYRFYCLMYRARLAVALRNTKAAKKDVKSALDVLDQELRHAPLLTPHPHTTGSASAKGEGNSSEVALQKALHCQHHAMVNVLKAYLEYMRQNVRKAMKLLTLCQFNFAESLSHDRSIEGDEDRGQRHRRKGADEDGEDQIPTDFHPAQDEACAAVFFNNLGCIHFMMHKPNLAAFYFQKALRARGNPALTAGAAPSRIAAATPEGGKHGNLLGGKAGLTLPGVVATKHWLDRRAEVAYNAGLQMLMCDRPVCAFKCFEQCAPVFRTWPRLWIRLAECCIEMHRQSLSPAAGGAGEARDSDGAHTGAGMSSASTSWSRVAARSSSRGPVDASGGQRQLAWSIQGEGAHRRWLLTTSRSPPIGRRSVGGDEDDSGAKAERAAGADATNGEAAAKDGERPPALVGDGALIHAAMCLRNVIVLTAPMLPERSGSATGGADGAPEDLHSGRSGGVGGLTGAPIAGTGASSVAAAMTAAAVAGDKAPCPPSGGGGSRHQARDLLECEASLLEDAALVKLAYVCLCQHDYAAALRYSRQVLDKNHLLPQAQTETSKDSQQSGKLQSSPAGAAAADDGEETRKHWAFQAQNLPHSASTTASSAKYPSSVGCITIGVLYAAEALLLSGKPAEAKALLGSFVSGNAVSRGLELQSGAFSAAAGDPSDERVRATCGGLNPGASMGGFTPPSYLSHSTGSSAAQQAEKEKANNAKDAGHTALVTYGPTEFPRLGDTQCMLYTDLAALHIQDGHLEEAERCCERALQVQPRALAPLRTLVYILLRRGDSAQALQRLKQSRIQGPEAGGRPPQR